METPDEEFNRKWNMGDFDHLNQPGRQAPTLEPGLIEFAIIGGAKLIWWTSKGIWHGGKWIVKKAMKGKK